MAPSATRSQRGERTHAEVKITGNHDPASAPAVCVGDYVAARSHLGGILRPTVRRGTAGTVIARTPDGSLDVTFATGHSMRLDPLDVALIDDDDAI